MKSYTFGLVWIAANDEPADTDPDSVKGYISTLLLADLFEKEPEVVAQDIVGLRTGHVSRRIARALEIQGIDYKKFI